MERIGHGIASAAAVCSSLFVIAGVTLAASPRVEGAPGQEPLVRLKYAEFDPLREAPEIPEALRARAEARVYLVQFASTPTEAMRGEIEARGGRVLRFLTDNTHVVSMPARAVEEVARQGDVRWVGAYHPAYRLEEEIRHEALAGASGEGAAAKYSIELFERASQVEVARKIRALGGTIDLMTIGYRMEATLNSAQLLAVAHMEAVNYIDRAGPLGGDMDLSRRLLGAAPLLSGAGYTGEGVRGVVVDLGLDEMHAAFTNPPPLIQCTGSGTDPAHGTAMYGIIFGNGAGNAAATGMLPDREQGIFCLATATTDPYASFQELLDPAGPYRAVFRSQSFGSVRTMAYSTISAHVDDLYFNFDLLGCQSMGDSNLSARPEAWAKNILSIGGVTHHQSLGRELHTGGAMATAADGRMKPDLAGIRDGVLTTAPGNQFTEITGTSPAAAMVAGASGLVFQMWHEGVWRGFGGGSSVFTDRPAHSTARALLINSAYQYDWTSGGANSSITRPTQGWGMPDLEAMYEISGRTFIINDDEPLVPSQIRSYPLMVRAGEPALRATMVYLDPPGNPAAMQARINDLNLKVTAPDQTVYWGNHGLSAGIWSTPGGGPDPVNVVENVFIENPQPGLWTVEVIGEQIVQDAHLQTPELDAAFALVVSGVGCYANCDGSVTAPVLNVDDFTCFINAFAEAQGLPHQAQVSHYANCDGSTTAPALNVDDFTCFINAFAAGCS